MEIEKMTAMDLIMFLYDVQALQHRENDKELQELAYRALVIREAMVPNGMSDWRDEEKLLITLLLPDSTPVDFVHTSNDSM